MNIKRSLTNYSKPSGTFSQRAKLILNMPSRPSAEVTNLDPTNLHGYVPDYKEAVRWAADNYSAQDELSVEQCTAVALWVFENRPESIDTQDRDEISAYLAACKHNADVDLPFETLARVGWNELISDPGGIYSAAGDGEPGEPHWYAAHIALRDSAIEDAISSDETFYRSSARALSDFEDLARDARRSTELIAQKAFEIGFLYRDAWWKLEHEKAALKYYEQVEKNRESGRKGGQANKRGERYHVLDMLALDRLDEFAFAGDREAKKLARRLAADHDKRTAEPIFTIGSQLLSDRWFDDWLDHFRDIIKSASAKDLDRN
ncbi:hypothetical protein EYE35_17225 [Cereibacter sphaeroides]|nr:hypothetical protein EYE35_17225 [Cereibacter sphaeroides]